MWGLFVLLKERKKKKNARLIFLENSSMLSYSLGMKVSRLTRFHHSIELLFLFFSISSIPYGKFGLLIIRIKKICKALHLTILLQALHNSTRLYRTTSTQ